MKKNPAFDKLISCIVNNNTQEFTDVLEASPVNLDSKDSKGWTLLHYAAQYLTVEIGQILITKGADVNAKDDFGNNVLWRATFSSQGKGEFIELLLRSGADRFAKNNSGINPVELANTISNYNVRQFFKE